MLFSIIIRYKSVVSLCFVIVFSFISLIWQSNFLVMGLGRLNDILNPFTFVFHNVEKGINELFNSYIYYEQVKEERNILREKIKKIKDLQSRYELLKEENAKLRELLELKPPIIYKTVNAEVISKNSDSWFRSLIIDKGFKDGIQAYMPVMGSQLISYSYIDEFGKEVRYKKIVYAVVGKIIQVTEHSAKVLPITDKSFQLGVMLDRTHHWGILEGGSGFGKNLFLKYISPTAVLNPNDEIVTSGKGGIFPKGILVGYITKDIDKTSSFQTAQVNPVIDFENLEYVSVLLKKPDIDTLELEKKEIGVE